MQAVVLESESVKPQSPPHGDPLKPLKRVPTFKALKQEELKRLASKMVLRRKGVDVDLLVQGEPVPAVYIIKKGRVDVLVNGDRVAQRGVMDSLGEMSCLSGEKTASATVRTITPCLVWEIDRQSFMAVIRDIPSLQTMLNATITKRLNTLSHRFSEILKHIPHGIVKIDLNGTITDEFSSRCTDYLGISNLNGRKLGDILFAGDPPLTDQWNRLIQSFDGQNTDDLLPGLKRLPEELAYQHPDGEARVFRLAYHLTVDAQGAVNGIDIAIDDITQRRWFQDELSSFQNLMVSMEQMLIMVDCQTGLIIQETITQSHLGQMHFPAWKHLKGKNIVDSVLKQQDAETKAHFSRWLNMLGESFILETMNRDEVLELAPLFVFETVTGEVVQLSFTLKQDDDGTYSEILGKFEFLADEPDEEGNRVPTMVLMEEVVAAEAEHQSALSEALNEMQISLEYAQSQMATPSALVTNHRKVAGLFHSVKGLAQSFGISTIATAAHELEDALEESMKSGNHPDILAMLIPAYKSLLSLIVVSKSLTGTEHTRDLGHCRSRDPEIRMSMDQFNTVKADMEILMANIPAASVAGDLAPAVKRLREAFSSMELMPLARVFPRLERIVTDTASLLNKQVVFDITEKKPVHLSLPISHLLSTCLIQTVKNALYHGVESPAERKLQGKPEKSRIELVVNSNSDRVFISVKDDGRGIKTDKILDRALQLNLVDQQTAEQLRAENRRTEILSFIFHPGFSTAGSVSMISGRGVGMSLIKTEVESVGGEVKINSLENRGTELLLSLPVMFESDTSQSGGFEF